MTNRGSKICANPFSAKLLPAFENERTKITLSAQLASIFQVSFGGNIFCAIFSMTKHQLNFKVRVFLCVCFLFVLFIVFIVLFFY